MSIGVIGVGRIGTPLVARLVAAGHEVLAADIRPERRYDAEKNGATWLPDAPQVAAVSSVVFTVLPGTFELEQLVLGSDQLLSHLDDSATWIDMTSASVEVGQECARRARELGLACLDAPIGGGVSAMRQGTVALYVGGDSAVLDTATGLLRSFATTIHVVEELDSIEHSAEHAGTPHPLTSAVAELHRLALQRYGAVDGELMAAAWLEEQAGSRLQRDPTS